MSDGSGYFLYHSIGQYPGKAEALAAAMAEFARVWGAADDGQWGYALTQRARFVERWRAILGAPEGSVTTCESVTQGMHMLMTALPKDRLRGKTVLVAARLLSVEPFPSDGPAGAVRLHACEPCRCGRARPGSRTRTIFAAWGPDVGLALLTWVSSTSSHRVDLAPLVAHGRRMGSVIGVDITQAAGLLPFSVTDPAVDFTVSTSLKWMCGTPGAGILHVAPATDRGVRAGVARLVQPGEPILVGSGQVRLCARHPPLRQRHAGGDGGPRLAARARLARRAGRGGDGGAEPADDGADHRRRQRIWASPSSRRNPRRSGAAA